MRQVRYHRRCLHIAGEKTSPEPFGTKIVEAGELKDQVRDKKACLRL
jgi:hypothetical protein